MTSADPTTSLVSWQGIASLFGALGLGGLLTALAQRPSRQNAEASAVRDKGTGEAAVIAAMANGFTEVTSSLREEIERLQGLSATFEADLAAAHERAVALERLVERLTRDLEMTRVERDEWKAKAEQLAGEVRQLQQVLTSTGRGGGIRTEAGE